MSGQKKDMSPLATLKIATVIIFVAGVISAFNGKAEASLMFLSIGFGLVYCFESDIDWTQKLSRKTIIKDLTESRWRVTAVGKLSQYLSFILMILFLIVHYS